MLIVHIAKDGVYIDGVLQSETRRGDKCMIRILGTDVSKRAILLSQIHNAVEILGMTIWLSLVLAHRPLLGFVVLAVTLTVEHILALAAGKQA